ncbi:MAG: hypothetical protein QXF12_01100, partial [Candidatus Aenigmatarchaeota archaeon]
MYFKKSDKYLVSFIVPVITKIKSKSAILITPIVHNNQSIINSLKNENIDFFYNNNFFLSD